MAQQKSDWLSWAAEAFEQLGKKELSVHEIAHHIEKTKHHLELGLDTEALASKFSSALAVNCKSKNARFKKAVNSKTKRPKKGFYCLKTIKTKSIKPIIINNGDQISTQYTGKAGEFALLSELLFYGFNASIMSVDDGIDVVASSKNLDYFHFQVKTTVAKDSKQDVFSFNLARDKFSKNNNAKTYYIFVMRCLDDKRWYNDYAVIPSTLIDYLHFQNDSASDRVTIKIENKKYYVNKMDITKYINNFKGIKQS